MMTPLNLKKTRVPGSIACFTTVKPMNNHFTHVQDDTMNSFFSYPAIEWWMKPEQRRRLPLLSKMAIDIYSCQPWYGYAT